jgi:hypothetical protein
MRISPETRRILTNLSAIDNNLVIEPSTTGENTHLIIATTAIVVCAKIKEVFTKQVKPKDLSQLVKILGFSNESELEVFDTHCVVKANKTKTTLRYREYIEETSEKYQTTVKKVRENGILNSFKDPLSTFELPAEVLAQIIKMDSVIKSDKVLFGSKNGKFSIKLFDSSQISDNNGVFDVDASSSDIYTFDVEPLSEITKDFQVVLNFDIFKKILQGPYLFNVFLGVVVCKNLENHVDIEYAIPSIERESKIF